MEVTSLGMVVIPIFILFFIFFDIKYLFVGTFIFSAFTSTSIINITSIQFSLLAVHFTGMLFIIKVVIYTFNNRLPIKITYSKSLLLFMVICAISLVYPATISKGEIIIDPHYILKVQEFSITNLTQYAYLIFGFLIYMSCTKYIINSKFDEKKILDLIAIASIVVIMLGFLQLVIPIDKYDSLFRTISNKLNDGVNGIVRISSVNSEASKLSLFSAPITVMYLNGLKNKYNRFIYVATMLLFILISILNNSSTYFVAILVCFVIQLILKSLSIFTTNIKSNYMKISWKTIFIFYFLCFLLVFAIFVYKEKVIYNLNTIIAKYNSEITSGIERNETNKITMTLFYNYLLTGVGFGSTRSLDLLSGWLACIGLTGVMPFIYFVFSRIKLLYKNRNNDINYMLFGLILTTMIALCISVPEPYYLYIWIYFSIADIKYNNFKRANCFKLKMDKDDENASNIHNFSKL